MCIYLQRLQCFRAPYVAPPPEIYERFNDLFTYTLTPDQVDCISKFLACVIYCFANPRLPLGPTSCLLFASQLGAGVPLCACAS